MKKLYDTLFEGFISGTNAFASLPMATARPPRLKRQACGPRESLIVKGMQ